MTVKRIFFIILTVLFVVSLSACGSSGGFSSDGTIANTKNEVIPSGIYICQDEMNNYMQHDSGFAHDSSSIYFTDLFYRYSFDTISKNLKKELLPFRGDHYGGVIAEGIVFTDRGQLLDCEDLSEGWCFYSEIEIDGSLTKIWPQSAVLPCGEYVYYLYDPDFLKSKDEMILRAPINNIEETDNSTSVNEKEFKCLNFAGSEVVFQQDGLSFFGIYGNHIVATTESCDCWVIDKDTLEAHLIIDGSEIKIYVGSKPLAVDGDYIYFSNDVASKIERIRLDGTGRETFLDGMNGSLFNISGGYLYHIASDENGKRCLYRTNLLDASDQIVLASGMSEGISDDAPCIVGDWVYYGSITYGFWRAKTDGSKVERITYAAYCEQEPQWDVEAFEKHNIAAGYEHTVAIQSDGTVVATGKNDRGQCDVSDWTDIVSVYATQGETIGIKSDGTFCATGGLNTLYGITNSIAFDLRFGATLAVKSDGSVVGGCTLGGGAPNSWTSQVETWTDIIAAATSANHTIGLKKDGTVVAAGANSDGQCDVYNWSDIIAVAAGSKFSVGLKADGTVITAGDIQELNWSDIVSISAAYGNVIGLKRDGTVVTNNKSLSNWKNIVEVCAGGRHYAGVCSDGTVVTSGENTYKQCDTEEWDDIIKSR